MRTRSSSGSYEWNDTTSERSSARRATRLTRSGCGRDGARYIPTVSGCTGSASTAQSHTRSNRSATSAGLRGGSRRAHAGFGLSGSFQRSHTTTRSSSPKRPNTAST